MDEILETFLSEGSELLNECTESFQKASGPDISIDVPLVMRNLHTLKGNAQFLQLGAFAKLVHDMEGLVAATKSTPITPNNLTLLIDLTALLSQWLEQIGDGSYADKLPSDVLERIHCANNQGNEHRDRADNQDNGHQDSANKQPYIREDCHNDHGNNQKLIILIDDDVELLEVLKQSFSEEMFPGLKSKILSASNGKEGVHLAQNNRPDLIVTDLVMPELDGLAFIKEVRGFDHLKDVPILFTSAYFDTLNTTENQQYFDKVLFLSKPFKLKTIQSYVKMCLASEAG